MTPADIARLAREALEEEVLLTPKPGLVDRENSGAHRDMDCNTFLRSARALEPCFARLAEEGARLSALPPEKTLSRLRPIGLEGEKAMFAATGGVNTHKGALFSMGLLCASAGRRTALGESLTAESICRTAAQTVSGISRELTGRDTHGLRACAVYGGRGVRGEAEDGFPGVLRLALPAYLREREARSHEEAALIALLALMAEVDDTTVLHRGGREGLDWLKAQAREQLAAFSPEGLRRMDSRCIARGLSPGGCADLLAVTLFLLRLTA